MNDSNQQDPIIREVSSDRQSRPTVRINSSSCNPAPQLTYSCHKTLFRFFCSLLQYNKSITRGMNCIFRDDGEWDYGLVSVKHYFKTCSYVTEIVHAGYWDISVLLCVTWSILFNLLWDDSLSFIFISVLCCKPQGGNLRVLTFNFYFVITFFLFIGQLGEMTGNTKRGRRLDSSPGALQWGQGLCSCAGAPPTELLGRCLAYIFNIFKVGLGLGTQILA